jgi:hypothetical protein
VQPLGPCEHGHGSKRGRERKRRQTARARPAQKTNDEPPTGEFPRVSALSVSAKITLGLLFVLVGVTMLIASDTLFRWALGLIESGLGREHLQKAKPRKIEDLRQLIYMLGGESCLVGALFFLGISRTGWRRFVTVITEDACRRASPISRMRTSVEDGWRESSRTA